MSKEGRIEIKSGSLDYTMTGWVTELCPPVFAGRGRGGGNDCAIDSELVDDGAMDTPFEQ